MKRCRTKHCREVATKSGHSPFCSKCRSRRFAEAHPLKYSFGKLRYRAGERGHSFELTFEQYQRFAVETGYDKLKGKTQYSLSIDRKDGTKGYHADNIRAVSLSLNSRLKWANMPEWLRDEMILAEQGKIRNVMPPEHECAD